MPSVGQTARKGHHITVHIKREPVSPSTALATTTPTILRLHVAQVSSAEALLSVSSSDPGQCYTWDSPLLKGVEFAGLVSDESSAQREHHLLMRPIGWRGVENEVEIQAWDGPRWGQGKDFVALVEFDSQKVLRSDVQTADVVC